METYAGYFIKEYGAFVYPLHYLAVKNFVRGGPVFEIHENCL